MSQNSPLTNTYVQGTIATAVSNLNAKGDTASILTATLLAELATWFASGNDIPARGGMGLKEAVALAEYYAQ